MDSKLYNYPIASILNQIGCRKGFRDMYFSPFRDEKEPSLHVDHNKNLWFDHGMGVGGTNVQLVMMVNHCSEDEAKKYIAGLDPNIEYHAPEAKQAPKSRITSVKPLFSYYLKKYIDERKIPEEVAKHYVKEVKVHNFERNQDFTLVGFENNAGGYAMRAPGGFKTTDRAGVTTIDTNGERTIKVSSQSVAVFEGFFDFLSWLVMQNTIKPTCDVVVLNSIVNLDRAIPYLQNHQTINCFLDRDEAGRQTQERIEKLFPDKEIKDMSKLYSQYKDLNEMLQQSRGYNCKTSMH